MTEGVEGWAGPDYDSKTGTYKSDQIPLTGLIKPKAEQEPNEAGVVGGEAPTRGPGGQSEI